VKRDFTAVNESLLGPVLDDVNNDNIGLINFIRGEGREWKLGDINHSNPIVVGPPNEPSNVMGDGYLDFINDWNDRPKVMYVGTNDGMLHCFDLLTGEELWGFIPYNLLPKLKNMWAVDQINGTRYFLRDVYVDGTPVAADVQLNGNWRTILICGQGPGKGSIIGGGVTGNFYFALDVTDPLNPQPLWECTHATMGETWSVPVVGRVTRGAGEWVAFMGSGYDNYDDARTGNQFYAVDIQTGEVIWISDTGDVNTQTKFGFSWDIPNALPGSPNGMDYDQDGYLDYVYFGDLDGRLWKINTRIPYITSDSWDKEIFYEDPFNYPIICKPEVWMNPALDVGVPHVFFGTGGDDLAPNNVLYSFIALIDSGAVTQADRVNWYLGDPGILNLPVEKDVGDLGIGEKVWADPKIGDYVVYFSTLVGSIESVDPCENIAGVGKLYARFIVSRAGSVVGGSAFKTAGGPVESLNLAIKTRSAVTLGEQERTSSGVRKREVYIQEYDSTIQKLEQVIGGLLKIKSWREVYKIIR
jgi:Tfp pilus tip-associated adhesin PilY1